MPIWLPAGIALAGCYLWWWRFFPAVFLASFLFNCSVTPDFALTKLLENVGWQNSLIAFGAMLQAIVGASLLRFWLGNPIVQYKGNNSFYFVFIVGFVSDLPAADVTDVKLKLLSDFLGEEGFPDLVIEDHSLVEVSAMEKGGLVYVMQEGTISPQMLENSRDYFTPEQELFKQSENTDPANWKLLTETLLEGYHIKSLHRKSFFPYGLDNVNLVETYGANARVTFPFRRIEKLRDVPVEKRRAAGMLTSVYHLFPNASVSVLSKHSNLTIMEPLSPSSTQMVIYLVTPEQTSENPISLEDVKKDAQFVNESGQDEDREAACLIQQTVTAQANSHLTFGYFEKAIVNFHQHLTERIDS